MPEASTLGRFRTQLVKHDVWDRLLAEINRQIEAKNIIMSQGRINIIDATPIEAAQSGPGNGIDDQVQRKGYRNNPLSCADKVRNEVIAVTRAGGERPFATYKRHYGLARTRFMRLAKKITFYDLATMAVNLRKGARFLTLYELPKLPPQDNCI